jgi:hypothetical protein
VPGEPVAVKVNTKVRPSSADRAYLSDTALVVMRLASGKPAAVKAVG